MRSLDEGVEKDLIVVFDDAAVQKSTDKLIRTKSLESNHPLVLAHRVALYHQDKKQVMDQVPPENWQTLTHHSHLPVSVIRFKSRRALTQWLATPGVAGVYENKYENKALAESLPLISQAQAAAAGNLGAGTSVAILDTGVNYTRSEFGSCSAAGIPSECKVVFAQDFATDDGSLDADGHGTNVAAIVLGVAPATKIISLDVFGSAGTSSVADQISAINWVIANKSKYNIVAMNLSLGGGKYLSSTADDPRKVVFDTARAAGILTVASAGNDGYSNALSLPAAITGVVSVGAVYDAPLGSRSWGNPTRCTDSTIKADQVTCFSNSASFLTMFAPGAMITAGGSTKGGTSQAAPHVAGAIAVLRGAYPAESLDQTVSRLTTGVLVTDSRNDVTKPRLNLRMALGNIESCTFTLSSNQIALPGQAGSGSVDVTTNAGCSWMAGVSSNNSSWITTTSGTSVSGNGSVAFNVSANPNAQSRTGTISIAGLVYTVVQQGSSTNSYNLLANPDFESGDVNWGQSTTNGSPIVTSYLNPSGTNTRYAWLCGYDNCVDKLFQDFTIPSDASAAVLQFQYQISTEETNPNVDYDKLKVSIFSPPTNPLASMTASLSNVNAKSGWSTSQSLDLTALKGNAVRIQFSGSTDASLITSFYLDDIQLNVSGTPPDNQKPTVPAGLTASVNGPNSITLTWSAALDNVGVTQYQIYRNKVFLKAVSATVLRYNDLSVLPASLYAYSVIACDVAGNCSNASVDVQVKSGSLLIDGDPPSVPLGLKATAMSQTSIIIGWTASTDNVGVVSYNIYRNGSLLTSVSARTAYLDSALTPTTYYSYSLAACDAAGNCSSQSLAASTYTESPPNLSPIVFSGTSSYQVSGNLVSIKVNEIKNTSQTSHSGSLRLELWAFSSPYVGVQAIGYKTASIRTSGVSGMKDYLDALTSFSNISLNLPYVTPPSAYKYFALIVTEYDTTNCTTVDHFCPVNYVNYHESVPPTVPTLSSAIALNSAQVQLTWMPATDASGVSNYKIYRNGTLIAILGNVLTYTDGGLNPSTSYAYKVAACDISQNCSDQSTTISVSTLTFQDISPPTVPTGLVGTALSSSNIKLTWAASTDNIGVVNYKLYINGIFLADMGNTLTVIRSNAPATQYNYSLSACDAAGNCSANSSVLSVTTPALVDSQPPSIPSALSAQSNTPTTVTLNWTAATDNLAVTNYKVFRSNILLTTLGPVTTFEDTGLKPLTSYAYKVQACDSAGNCSADSLTTSLITKSLTETSTTSTSTTTIAGTTTTSTPLTANVDLFKGWNLIGNGADQTINVGSVFNDATKFTTVWKWVANSTKWAFYAPSLSGSSLTSYAEGKGYDVLTSINAGEGFWVNTAQATTVNLQTGTTATGINSSSFQVGASKALPIGWSLIAIGDSKTASEFNLALSVTPPTTNAAPLNLTTLWAWDASQSNWMFFAPSLANSGTLSSYISSKNYLGFGSKTLTPAMGFWVNKP